MHVLLIEDSERLCGALRLGLQGEGYAVDVATDGLTGLSYARSRPYDVILLDLMLPVMDGMTLLRELRQAGVDTHVLILTARDSLADLVEGLDAGADDYVSKPFHWSELKARLRSLVRRRYQRKQGTLKAGSLVLDPVARVASVDGRRIAFSPREFAVLEYILLRHGETASPEEIAHAIYEDGSLPPVSAVTTIVCRIRTRLKGLAGVPPIRTVRGVGYGIAEE